MIYVPNKHLLSLRSTENWAVAKGMIMSESWCKFSLFFSHYFFTKMMVKGKDHTMRRQKENYSEGMG